MTHVSATRQGSPPVSAATAFDQVVSGLTRCRDAAHARREWPVGAAADRLLIAAYELLRDGLVGDRHQQLAAAFAACGHRQPTVLAQRGLRVHLVRDAARTATYLDQNMVTVLTFATQWELLADCVHEQPDIEPALPCECLVCLVAVRRSHPN